MQTIKLEIEVENDLCEDIKDSGINIQKKIKEYSTSFFDKGYPSISKDEATKRVSDAVQRYGSGELTVVPYAEGMKDIDDWLEKL